MSSGCACVVPAPPPLCSPLLCWGSREWFRQSDAGKSSSCLCSSLGSKGKLWALSAAQDSAFCKWVSTLLLLTQPRITVPFSFLKCSPWQSKTRESGVRSLLITAGIKYCCECALLCAHWEENRVWRVLIQSGATCNSTRWLNN